jgi:hypothetical protein
MREFEYGLIRTRTPSGLIHIGRKTRYSRRFVFVPEDGDTVIQIRSVGLADVLKSLVKRPQGLDLCYVRPLCVLPRRKRGVT